MGDTTTAPPTASTSRAQSADQPGKGSPAVQRDRAAVKGAQVLELRAAGYTFARIAEAVGYSSAASAKKAFDRAIAAEQGEQATQREEMRAQQNLRINRLLSACWGKATSDPTGRAMTNAIRLLERQARLNGLDAPMNLKITDRMDEEIEALMAQLAGLEA